MLIHLEKLGKSFGEKVVLHDVSASVEKEDRIGIVGQNGAGKTTLLKILTGVYTCLLYTSPSPRDYAASRMPSSA